MSQLNAKEALGKKACANKTTPDVLNRKKVVSVAPRLLTRLSLEMQNKKSTHSSFDASASISKILIKPLAASTTKTTSNKIVKSKTSASMPKPTSTPTTSPTPTPTTPTTSPTPTPNIPTTSPTPTPTTPTTSPTPRTNTPITSPTPRTNTITATGPVHTSNNTTTIPEPTPTITTSSPVNTSTTHDDHVEEIDVVQTISTTPDGRIAVTVFNKILVPTDKCATIISGSFLERVDPNGYRWANVSQDNKDFYWDEFKKHCFWEEEDEAKVRTAWKTKASLAYSQYVFNMRNHERNKTRKRPNHVSEKVWASWLEKWNSDDFKKISNQNKINRRNGVLDAPARPTHTAGSASHLKIASKLKRTLGCEPPHSEFFLYTHTANHDGESFINDKDREIHASYLEKRKQLEATGEDVDDDSIFYEVIGGHDRKRRMYGFGSYGKLIPSKKGSNDTYYPPETNANKKLAEKNAELAQMKELVTA